MEIDNDLLWDAIVSREGKIFRTHRGKDFSYHVKKNKAGETQSSLTIDNSSVVISRATVLLAYHNAAEIQEKKGYVKKPGMLGAYGDVYLYPVFLDIGICTDHIDESGRDFSGKIRVEKLVHAGEEQEQDQNQKQEKGQGQERKKEPDQEKEPIPPCCEFCGYPINEEFEFCPKCGKKLRQETRTQETLHC